MSEDPIEGETAPEETSTAPEVDGRDTDEVDSGQPSEADLDEAAKAPEDYAPGGDQTSYEDTAPPGSEPGNDALAARDAATTFEQGLIARNQRRFDLRSGGMSSAEVNEIERSEREEGR